MGSIPKSLQGVLWSADVKKLDLKKDAPYIINQILSYGTIEEMRWLFKTYKKPTVRKVFLDQPMKVYSSSAFQLSKLLLDISQVRADRYDQTLPRHIG